MSGVTVKRIYAELPTATESYTLQERCGKSAASDFKELGWTEGPTRDKDGLITATYEAHYSPKLNRCFSLILTHRFAEKGKDVGSSDTSVLADVLAHKTVGEFNSVNDKNNLMKPVFVECKVDDATCANEEEFKAAIKPYLTE